MGNLSERIEGAIFIEIFLTILDFINVVKLRQFNRQRSNNESLEPQIMECVFSWPFCHQLSSNVSIMISQHLHILVNLIFITFYNVIRIRLEVFIICKTNAMFVLLNLHITIPPWYVTNSWHLCLSTHRYMEVIILNRYFEYLLLLIWYNFNDMVLGEWVLSDALSWIKNSFKQK